MTKYLQSIKLYSFLALTAFPLVSFAQNPTPTTFGGLVNNILEVINIVIPAIFGVVFLIIVWKIVNSWIINGADPTKRQEGRQLVPIAIIVFVLMMITWGVIALLRNTFFGG